MIKDSIKRRREIVFIKNDKAMVRDQYKDSDCERHIRYSIDGITNS